MSVVVTFVQVAAVWLPLHHPLPPLPLLPLFLPVLTAHPLPLLPPVDQMDNLVRTAQHAAAAIVLQAFVKAVEETPQLVR